jgi:hypothetical protein
MHDDHIAHIGIRHVWGGEQPFGLSSVDRRQHLYVVGKTGTGKTTLLRNLILADIEAGRGVGVLDPHGDLAEDLLEHIPRRRTDHVIYFNPADQEYPIAFNLLKRIAPESRHLVASSIVSALKSVWRDSWGPRLEYLLYACVAALLECQGTSILGIPRMLTDPAYRAWVIKQVEDDSVRSFWLREFSGWDKRFLAEVISPVQNKVGQLLMAAPLRNVLGQISDKFDLRFAMDQRRILIANLSKGLLGEDKANLLGAVLVSQFQTAAMGRANIPEHDRVDFHLYVDEFHNFATDSFSSILAEMRKYRLCLTLSHQHLEQVRPEICHAVFGNIGSMIAFRVGESDAEVLSREFGGGFDPGLFSDLANAEICAKILAGGRHSDPFLAKTYPPTGRRYGRGYNLVRRSRERYATPREVVEDRIRRWMRSSP